MRTTLRIDDDLLKKLQEQARRSKVPLTVWVNRVLRRGLEAAETGRGKPRRPYREQGFAMGLPRVPLDKALALAAQLEDDEVAEEMARRKCAVC
ncbi:MAG: hypothetical protein ACYC3X_20600 [Pirellulaceae bacterium]